MYTKKSKIFKGFVIFLIILTLVSECEGVRRKVVKRIRTKVKSVYKPISNSTEDWKVGNNDTKVSGRGFFPSGGILSFGKVLNFLPVGDERECVPAGPGVARAGICLNPYDCRQRDGRAAGDCAHGLGVCCVFEVSCGGVVQNNLTFFMSPGFPELWSGDSDCNITIEKTHAGIMQLRVDFIHFTIGQPNRTTGECDEDAMILADGSNNLVLCGQNHGQHLYFGMSTGVETREEGDLAGARGVAVSLRMRARDTPRLWLLRLAQLPLAHSAPHGCLQYYTHTTGTIKTFNYAVNGRHLSGHEYKACVRRNVGFCTVRYAPCHERAFRIEPGERDLASDEDFGPGQGMGAGTGFYGPDESFMPGPINATMVDTPLMDQEQLVAESLNASSTPVPVVDEDGTMNDDEIEGSGDDPQIAPPDTVAAPASKQSLASELFQYVVLPPWMWQRSGRKLRSWSPYMQHYAHRKDATFQYHGYGNFGAGLRGYGRQRCRDRVTIPCENEYFVSSGPLTPGVCDPHHCGDSFCPHTPHHECRVETSISPFAVSFYFGPPTPKRNPENNIGACIKYTQLPCDSRT